ncbi:MAG TPA: hypothetical protein VMB50_10380 [Myxococcales bacterium]|nr:hypothetical protein [Myxococcales bacterium]
MRRRMLLCAGTAALLNCGGASDAIYIRAVSAPFTTPSGTNCPSTTTGTTVTATNEGTLGNATIFLAPNNVALLDPTSQGTTLLQGTQNGSNYAFSGKIIDDSKSASNETLTEDDLTVSLTVNGNAVSGTASVEEKVTCESGCTGVQNSDCVSTSQFQGTIVPGVQNQTTLPN